MDLSNWLQRRKCYIVQRKQNLTFDWLIGLIDRLVGQMIAKLKTEKSYIPLLASLLLLLDLLNLFDCHRSRPILVFLHICLWRQLFHIFKVLSFSEFKFINTSTLPQFPAHLSVKVTFMVFHIDTVLSSFFQLSLSPHWPLARFPEHLCVGNF